MSNAILYSATGARYGFAVTALLAFVFSASAQWVESTILLPDELSGVASPRVLCYNETDEQLYVSDWLADCVVIIDARTFRKVGRYLPGYGVSDLVWSREHNRVYSADYYASTVTVYGVRAGQVIATISGLDRPWRLLLDEPRDKLYIGCEDDLVVVDLATHTVRTRIPILGRPGALHADTVRNRVLVTGVDDGLYFVDSDADTVTGFVPIDVHNRNILALNHQDQKLYIAGTWSTRMAIVHLADDSVAGPFFLHGLPNRLAWCPSTNRLFAATRDGLRVLDGASDTLIASVRCYAADLVLDGELGRVYVCETAPDTIYWIPTHLAVRDLLTLESISSVRAGERLSAMMLVAGSDPTIWVADETGAAIAAYDRATGAERTRLNTGAKTYALAWNSVNNRLYVTNGFTSTISVIDGNSLHCDTVNIGHHNPGAVHWVPDNNKLYVTTRSYCNVFPPPQDQRIVVLDGATNQILASHPGAGLETYMAYSRTSDKVYIGHSHTFQSKSKVTVIDGSTDEVLGVISLPHASFGPLLWYPDSNWVFRGGSREIEVIDCATDAVIASIPGVVWPARLLYNSINNTIYCTDAGSNELVLIDPAARQVRKRLAVDAEPERMAWDSVGNRILVGSTWGGAVDVIDCDRDSVIATIETPGSGWVHSLVWNYLNSKLYVTELIHYMIHIVDGVSLEVKYSIPMPAGQMPSNMAWDPVMNRTYVASEDGSKVTVLRDNPPGIVGPGGTPAGTKPVVPTIVRGSLVLPRDIGAGHSPILPGESGLCPKPAQLLDATGRKVMDLQPGDNDVRHLAPGVYFIRAEGPRGQGVEGSSRKVVIQR
ncbi:MAG TPA: hypothetical protein ENN51_04775 [candidate division WOR-3 bacterium]|uniref:YncE family protein n=1 Tax=candidate division WOR-3 bacterium TaxID=2052148 RepID=A0A7V0T5J9_UNCW3|nr:hypothetical protein [candidate division WOR-3 bacterium]